MYDRINPTKTLEPERAAGSDQSTCGSVVLQFDGKNGHEIDRSLAEYAIAALL